MCKMEKMKHLNELNFAPLCLLISVVFYWWGFSSFQHFFLNILVFHLLFDILYKRTWWLISTTHLRDSCTRVIILDLQKICYIHINNLLEALFAEAFVKYNKRIIFKSLLPLWYRYKFLCYSNFKMAFVSAVSAGGAVAFCNLEDQRSF